MDTEQISRSTYQDNAVSSLSRFYDKQGQVRIISAQLTLWLCSGNGSMSMTKYRFDPVCQNGMRAFFLWELLRFCVVVRACIHVCVCACVY